MNLKRNFTMECFVCKSKDNLVTYFPTSAKQLKIWKDNLNLTNDDSALKKQKLCIKHFDAKFHNILLNPNLKRGRYIFPSANPATVSSSQNASMPSTSQSDENIIKSNYELLVQEKESEIFELKHKLNEALNENKSLMKELQKRDSIKFAIDKINNAEKLTPAAKTMIDLLLIKNHRYSDSEKAFCQNFYGKFPGAYVYLNKMLGSCLPSRRTLVRWQTFKDLNIGLIPEVMGYLKSLNEKLNIKDKNIVLTLDEMDGKKGVRYCSTRDALIGYSHLTEQKPILAKKFLVFMVRGLNNTVGNVVIASYATENGIKGNELAILIRYLIKELKVINYSVCFVNQDQSGVNRKAFDVLGATIENPYFFVDEQKVWTVFDFPHLSKSVSDFLSINFDFPSNKHLVKND